MLTFLAPAALKLLFGRALSHAKGDAMATAKWLTTLNGPQLLALILAGLLLVDHIGLVLAHRHSGKVESQLATCSKSLTATRTAFATTVANYRAAAAKAAADDKANADRVRGDQAKINQETSNEYETRIAHARAAAQRLRDELAAAANSGSVRAAPVPGVPAPAQGPDQAPGNDGLSVSERLTATEQAIQLDELIKWVKKQAGVDVNGSTPPAPAKP